DVLDDVPADHRAGVGVALRTGEVDPTAVGQHAHGGGHQVVGDAGAPAGAGGDAVVRRVVHVVVRDRAVLGAQDGDARRAGVVQAHVPDVVVLDQHGAAAG